MCDTRFDSAHAPTDLPTDPHRRKLLTAGAGLAAAAPLLFGSAAVQAQSAKTAIGAGP